MNFEFADGYGSKNIGGAEFDQMNVVLTFQGQRINQQYYATKFDDYIVAIIARGNDQSTNEILNSINFDW